MTTSDLIRIFGRIGCLSFGGPAAQIALMQRELVNERALLSQADFLKALSFCMLLPGPEAMQLATYAGWKLKGTVGGLIAGLLFVLPGAFVIAALAFGYAAYGDIPFVQAAFLGIKATVVIIVIGAILRLWGKALGSADHRIIAVLAFIALFFFDLPFPLIILLSGLYGFIRCRDTSQTKMAVPWKGSLKTLAFGSAIWFAPLALVWAAGSTFLFALGLFFAILAVVTFGGAYAVLAYMTQAVVIDFGWLTTQQMIDALGLAETTPGPLILVTQFVGILAGLQEGGVLLGALAGLLTLWMTFVPCFIWIFAGAPLIDWLDSVPRLRAALAAITAAVVGVIASLGLWFGVHVVFTQIGTASAPFGFPLPVWSSFDPAALTLTLLAAALLLWRKVPMLPTLGLMALAGVAMGLLG